MTWETEKDFIWMLKPKESLGKNNLTTEAGKTIFPILDLRFSFFYNFLIRKNLFPFSIDIIFLSILFHFRKAQSEILQVIKFYRDYDLELFIDKTTFLVIDHPRHSISKRTNLII